MFLRSAVGLLTKEHNNSRVFVGLFALINCSSETDLKENLANAANYKWLMYTPSAQFKPHTEDYVHVDNNNTVKLEIKKFETACVVDGGGGGNHEFGANFKKLKLLIANRCTLLFYSNKAFKSVHGTQSMF